MDLFVYIAKEEISLFDYSEWDVEAEDREESKEVELAVVAETATEPEESVVLINK